MQVPVVIPGGRIRCTRFLILIYWEHSVRLNLLEAVLFRVRLATIALYLCSFPTLHTGQSGREGAYFPSR